MMNPMLKAICLSTAVAAMLLPAAAQTATTTTPSTAVAPSAATAPTTPPTATTPAKPPQTVHQRKLNQQNRIAKGVQNGGLTSSETAKLENKESDLTKEKQQMRTADGGHLSSADRHTLHQQQDKLSKQVYKEKHNANRQQP